MSAHSIYVAIRPSLYGQLFTGASTSLLNEVGPVHFQSRENLTPHEFATEALPHDIIVTSWGTPRFTDDVLSANSRLRFIAHAAGSIKWLLPDKVFDSDIIVSNASAAMVQSVAETTLMMIFMMLRKPHSLDRKVRSCSDWDTLRATEKGRELRNTRVGVVGAGQIGRAVIHMLRALDVEVSVYDPYLNSAVADELGAKLVSLNELLEQCSVVTLHAPSTPETHHMIGSEQLKLMPNGAMLINTARSWLIDGNALLSELQTGRISAALDVFDSEPLPRMDPLLQLDNVILTPHIGSLTTDAFQLQGQIAAEEISRFANDRPLLHRVTKSMLATMA